MSPSYANNGFYPRLSLNPSHPITVAQAQDIIYDMQQILDLLRNQLTMSQEKQTRSANQHHILAPAYEPDDRIWLNTKNIRTKQPCRKLDDKWIGLYVINKLVRKRAYELDLPSTLRIHPTFHVSLLRTAFDNLFPGQNNTRPGPVLGTDNDEPDTYVVEEIVDSKPARGRRKFKYTVKWQGWPHSENTEEPVEHLIHAPDAIFEFHERYPHKPRPVGYVHTRSSSQELAL